MMRGPVRPNPLTDELTSEAKAELAAMFANLKTVFERRYSRIPSAQRRGSSLPVWVTGGDRPHLLGRW